MSTNHTPTPWKLDDVWLKDIQGPDGLDVAIALSREADFHVPINCQTVGPVTRAVARANAELIVECVNAHAALTQERDEMRADALRYRAFWLNPVPPLLDDLGLHIFRYGSCKGVFNKAWCDQQIDATLAPLPTVTP